MEKICVVGSLNVDLTVTVPHFHQPGESMFGLSFNTYTGGKGGNQAVAAARLFTTFLADRAAVESQIMTSPNAVQTFA